MPFEIVRNDITKMQVDAIVNAAKESLLSGGGVDGCIHRAAGPGLLAECEKLGGCRTGSAKITKGYNLPCRYVIHAVGPIWRGGHHGEEALLTSCYRTALALAKENGCESIAFPLISAGAYGYPRDRALRVAADTIEDFLQREEMTVYLVVFDRESFDIGEKLFSDIAAYIDDHYADEVSQRDRRRLRGGRIRDAGAAAPPEPEESAVLQAPSFCEGQPLGMPMAYEQDLAALLEQLDEGFSRSLLRLIDERGMTDAQCYKRANIDRKLFSKIRNDPRYRPSKPTVLAFAVALRLTLPETRALLEKAGFAFSRASKFDLIVEYFIGRGVYNVFEINEALFAFDQSLLGG